MFYGKEMPEVPFSTIRERVNADDAGLVVRIMNPKTMRLRASKPPVQKGDTRSGLAAYLWRMVAFSISPQPRHHCMPVTADFDLPGSWGSEEHKAAQERMDRLADVVINAVPKEQWYGVLRWGRALGMGL